MPRCTSRPNCTVRLGRHLTAFSKTEFSSSGASRQLLSVTCVGNSSCFNETYPCDLCCSTGKNKEGKECFGVNRSLQCLHFFCCFGHRLKPVIPCNCDHQLALNANEHGCTLTNVRTLYCLPCRRWRSKQYDQASVGWNVTCMQHRHKLWRCIQWCQKFDDEPRRMSGALS